MTDVPTTHRGGMSASRRLRIWEAHGGICVLCRTRIDGVRERWIVEHLRALGLGGDDSDDNCGPAHEACADHKTRQHDIPAIAKAKRLKQRHLGIKKPSSFACSKASPWKKRMDGSVVSRATGEPRT